MTAVLMAAMVLLPARSAGAQPAVRADSPGVALTWLSITNWLLEAGDTRILLDGYLTRIDAALAAETGSDEPPPDLSRRALDVGPAYAAGFARGFADRREVTHRRAAWIGAGLGAAAGVAWIFYLLGSGYT